MATAVSVGSMPSCGSSRSAVPRCAWYAAAKLLELYDQDGALHDRALPGRARW